MASPLLSKNHGFSLIELIGIIVIIGIVSVLFSLRMAYYSDRSLVESQRLVLSTLRLARQIAMGRAVADNPVAVIIGANTIDLKEGGTSLVWSESTYPIHFPQDITISQGQGRYFFDPLGSTRSALIALGKGSDSITVTLEASGYAY